MVILVEYFYELQNFSTENIPFYMPSSNTQGSNSMYFQEFPDSIIQNDVILKQNYFPWDEKTCNRKNRGSNIYHFHYFPQLI